MKPAPHRDFLPYLLNRVVSQINAPMQKMLRRRGMTLTHWRILGILDETNGLIISELAERTVTDHATLSRALDRLEERALIKRVIDARDSRQFNVVLQPAGRREYREIADYAITVQAWAFREMSDPHLQQLRESLIGLTEAMNRQSSDDQASPDLRSAIACEQIRESV